MSEISVVLSVAYDSGDKDISCLVVAKREFDKFIVLNEFRGEEADKLYLDLLNKENKGRRMTNAEKYKEVFGFYPSFTDCICEHMCENCPIGSGNLDYLSCTDEFKTDWWNSEYEEKKNGTIN